MTDGNPCFIPLCENQASNRVKPGPCSGHQMRFTKRGTYDADVPLATASIQPERPGCNIEDCPNLSSRVDRATPCASHKARFGRTGSYGTKPLRELDYGGAEFPECFIGTCVNLSRTHTPGPCSGHYQRYRQTGSYQEDKPLRKAVARDTGREWIESLVALGEWPTEECVTWPFGRMPSGYGSATNGSGTKLVHRIVCEAVHGPPPFPDAHVRHSCGLGHEACVNPNHLRWGTHGQNMEDSARHGTLRSVKLTPAKVRYIRAHPEISDVVLAQMFGVVKTETIARARTGRSWYHVSVDGPVWSPSESG